MSRSGAEKPNDYVYVEGGLDDPSDPAKGQFKTGDEQRAFEKEVKNEVKMAKMAEMWTGHKIEINGKEYGSITHRDFTVGDVTYGVMGPFYATLAGILSGIIVGFVSEYFTSAKYTPVKQLAPARITITIEVVRAVLIMAMDRPSQPGTGER